MELSEEEGDKLLQIARRAIDYYLSTGDEPQVLKEFDVSEFPEPRGVFVTLRKKGELRGCIGFPLPVLPLGKAVIQAAVAAASSDFRFQSVMKEELPEMEIEISMLTEPKEIEVSKPEEYLEKIDVGRDGLIIDFMGYAGLLLPQVPVEEGWDVETFLQHLCIKAGLPPNTWRKEKVVIKAFQAEIIKEKK